LMVGAFFVCSIETPNLSISNLRVSEKWYHAATFGFPYRYGRR